MNAGPGAGEGKTFTLDKPQGIPVVKDVASAYKTIRAMGGQVPQNITGAIGFAGYEVQKGRSIKFKPTRKSSVVPARLTR